MPQGSNMIFTEDAAAVAQRMVATRRSAATGCRRCNATEFSIIANVHNAIVMLRSPNFAGMIDYDELQAAAMLRRPVPEPGRTTGGGRSGRGSSTTST